MTEASEAQDRTIEGLKKKIKQLEEPVVTREMLRAALDVLMKRDVILTYPLLKTLFITMHIARLEGLK